MNPRTKVKAQAELIGALFALLALIIVLVYLTAHVYTMPTRIHVQTQKLQAFKTLQQLEQQIEAVWDDKTKQLTIASNTTIEVEIVRIWVKKPDGTIEPEHLAHPLTLEPGQVIQYSISSGTPVYLETSRGTIIRVTQQPTEAQIQQVQQIVRAIDLGHLVTFRIGDIPSLATSNKIYIDKSLVTEPTEDNVTSGEARGMKRYFILYYIYHHNIYYTFYGERILVLGEKATNVCIELEGLLEEP